jgi:hypothetical protein
MGIRDYEEFGFQVIETEEGSGKVRDYIALTKNITVARAAFYAILPQRPGAPIFLMNGSRIVLDSSEETSDGTDPLSLRRR